MAQLCWETDRAVLVSCPVFSDALRLKTAHIQERLCDRDQEIQEKDEQIKEKDEEIQKLKHHLELLETVLQKRAKNHHGGQADGERGGAGVIDLSAQK